MLATLLIASALFPAAVAADWPQFRGPNATGVSTATGLPVEFGPQKNVVWRTDLPPGHSSPVISGERIFLTAVEQDKLFVIALDRAKGGILWRREVPRPRRQELHKSNDPASPSIATDGANIYAFFTDFGLISFDVAGRERWRLPLGPFNNPFGMGASPVLSGGTLLMICDGETGSFFIGVNKDTGKIRWRAERPRFTRGFSTPVLWRAPDGSTQAIVAGSLQLTAYSVETGKELWWTRGLTWQLKPTPVINGNTIYVLGWAGGADPGQQEEVPPFAETLQKFDKDADGKLSKVEAPDPKMLKDWRAMDLDGDGYIGERDWNQYQSRRSVQNGVNAFRLGGEGDMSDKALLWRYQKSLPNVPSPLLYDGVLYLMKEGGILTALDATNGAVLKQGRLPGALGMYYSSPVGADGKLYTASEEGKVTVLKAGEQWEVLATNDFGESIHATPALVDGRIYLRTRSALYCFANSQ